MAQVANDSLEAALARWVMGDANARTTRDALLALLARWSVVATLVRLDARERDESADASPRTAIAVAERFAGKRALLTASDADWAVLGAGATAAWLACEPIHDGVALVAMGDDAASMNDALAALPAIARAVGAVASAEGAADESRRLAHELKNGVSAVISNVEYATTLIGELPASRADGAVAARRELAIALRNVVEAAVAMTRDIDDMRRIACRGDR